MSTQREIIFRDDDLGYGYNIPSEDRNIKYKEVLHRFIEIDQLFIKYKVKHHVAIVANHFEKAKELITYIKEHPHIVVQLHCWDHIDYSESHPIVSDHLKKGIIKLESIFGKRPTVFYPPYNRVDEFVIAEAAKLGLTTSYQKMSLSGYLKGHEREVVNFHYWAMECVDLEAALIKYTRNEI